VVQILIMLTIGVAAGAASFTHVHDVASAHGQPGWLAWADAVTLELMSIAAGLELRRRERAHNSLKLPATVLVVAVALSLSAQVVEAEPSIIGWAAAALPAFGFLAMVKIALARGGTAGTSPDAHETAARREAIRAAQLAEPPPGARRPALEASVDQQEPAPHPTAPAELPAAQPTRTPPEAERGSAEDEVPRAEPPRDAPKVPADPRVAQDDHDVPSHAADLPVVPKSTLFDAAAQSTASTDSNPPPESQRRSSDRRPAAETRQLANDMWTAEPDLTRKEVAARLGVSPRWLREVLNTTA
jgi:hypothetical protein